MNPLIQYIKDSKQKRIGVMYAYKDDKNIKIGWSKCNKLDRFNRERGLEIAIGRAVEGSEVAQPRAVRKQLQEFTDRAHRYFNNPKGRRVEGVNSHTNKGLWHAFEHPVNVVNSEPTQDKKQLAIFRVFRSFFGV